MSTSQAATSGRDRCGLVSLRAMATNLWSFEYAFDKNSRPYFSSSWDIDFSKTEVPQLRFITETRACAALCMDPLYGLLLKDKFNAAPSASESTLSSDTNSLNFKNVSDREGAEEPKAFMLSLAWWQARSQSFFSGQYLICIVTQRPASHKRSNHSESLVGGASYYSGSHTVLVINSFFFWRHCERKPKRFSTVNKVECY